jgi:signal transduction histidine kinase
MSAISLILLVVVALALLAGVAALSALWATRSTEERLASTVGEASADERARISDLEREALERLQEADRLKEDFIATVSHELRTPLTSIKGYASTLIRREAELSLEERHSFLEVMVRQCDRLAQIIDTMLLVSRLEAGEIAGKKAYIGLADLLGDAAEAASDEDRFEISVESSIGLTSDHFRVFHIVRNLMENACKYSPPSSVVRVTAGKKGGHFEIDVEDQGTGIAEEDREKIFDRFMRLSDPPGTVISGTGLGLYIARRFAHDLGGDIRISEGEGGSWTGACFTLRLPANIVQQAPRADVTPNPG